MEYLRIPPLPLNQCCMDFDMSIKVTRNNIEWGRGVEESKQGLISFQRAALTRESDFQGECLNNFANACRITVNVSITDSGSERVKLTFHYSSLNVTIYQSVSARRWINIKDNGCLYEKVLCNRTLKVCIFSCC